MSISSCSLWLPLLAVLLSAAIVLLPAARVYMRWKAAIGPADKLTLRMGRFQWAIPRERMLWSAVEWNAMREQPTVTALNAPGQLLGALSSQLVAHHANAFPDPLGPFLWRVLSLPFFALPAWFFAGRGIDGLLMWRRMRLLDFILSAILVSLSVIISAGLRFGLSEAERAGDELLMSYILGFAWWSLLFAVPLSAWLVQRHRKEKAPQFESD